MLEKFSKFPWGILVTFVIGIPALVYFFIGFTPRVTIKNELATPIKIFAYENQKYLGQIGAYGRRTFQFTSKEVFPVKISWVAVNLKAQDGTPLGDIVQGSELVDNYRTLKITNTTSDIFYFMPVISNETDMTCKIYINDGLPSESYGGLLLPQKKRVNVGYYKWLGNSNVTLSCDGRIYWWGDRNGKKRSALTVDPLNGQTDLTLSP